MESGTAFKVLLVDVQQAQIECLNRGLTLYGYEVTATKSTQEAIRLIENSEGNAIDLLIVDLTEPEPQLLDLIASSRGLRASLPIIGVVGLKNTSLIEKAMEFGIALLQKPFDPDSLDGLIKSLSHRG